MCTRDSEHETGLHLDDDALMAAFARAVLAGGSSGGDTVPRPPHTIATTVCEKCDRGWIDAAGVKVEITPGAVAKAKCDAVEIGSLQDDKPAKATPVIPEPTRRMIFRRFDFTCAVPQCRSRQHNEIHHIDHDNRNHELSNLVLLCTAHHTLHHRGTLFISGASPDALAFAYADGRPYGTPPPGPAPDTLRADLESAMRRMGWDKKTSRESVANAMTQLGRDATIDQIMRAALREAGSYAAP